VVRAFRGVEFGESQKDLLRACARGDRDQCSVRRIAEGDQDFVINGEKRGDYKDEDYEDDRW
jgi:hypothetical protein